MEEQIIETFIERYELFWNILNEKTFTIITFLAYVFF